jgi:hypothetical protein
LLTRAGSGPRLRRPTLRWTRSPMIMTSVGGK